MIMSMHANLHELIKRGTNRDKSKQNKERQRRSVFTAEFIPSDT
jgi:hypothetical protein